MAAKEGADTQAVSNSNGCRAESIEPSDDDDSNEVILNLSNVSYEGIDLETFKNRELNGDCDTSDDEVSDLVKNTVKDNDAFDSRNDVIVTRNSSDIVDVNESVVIVSSQVAGTDSLQDKESHSQKECSLDESQEFKNKTGNNNDCDSTVSGKKQVSDELCYDLSLQCDSIHDNNNDDDDDDTVNGVDCSNVSDNHQDKSCELTLDGKSAEENSLSLYLSPDNSLCDNVSVTKESAADISDATCISSEATDVAALADISSGSKSVSATVTSDKENIQLNDTTAEKAKANSCTENTNRKNMSTFHHTPKARKSSSTMSHVIKTVNLAPIANITVKLPELEKAIKIQETKLLKRKNAVIKLTFPNTSRRDKEHVVYLPKANSKRHSIVKSEISVTGIIPKTGSLGESVISVANDNESPSGVPEEPVHEQIKAAPPIKKAKAGPRPGRRRNKNLWSKGSIPKNPKKRQKLATSTDRVEQEMAQNNLLNISQSSHASDTYTSFCTNDSILDTSQENSFSECSDSNINGHDSMNNSTPKSSETQADDSQTKKASPNIEDYLIKQYKPRNRQVPINRLRITNFNKGRKAKVIPVKHRSGKSVTDLLLEGHTKLLKKRISREITDQSNITPPCDISPANVSAPELSAASLLRKRKTTEYGSGSGNTDDEVENAQSSDDVDEATGKKRRLAEDDAVDPSIDMVTPAKSRPNTESNNVATTTSSGHLDSAATTQKTQQNMPTARALLNTPRMQCLPINPSPADKTQVVGALTPIDVSASDEGKNDETALNTVDVKITSIPTTSVPLSPPQSDVVMKTPSSSSVISRVRAHMSTPSPRTSINSHSSILKSALLDQISHTHPVLAKRVASIKSIGSRKKKHSTHSALESEMGDEKLKDIGPLNGAVYPMAIIPDVPEDHASLAEEGESIEGPPHASSPESTTTAQRQDALPLCCCKINGASINKLPAPVTFCQALDSIDGKVMGCCNKVSNSKLMRPAVKIPFMAICEVHRKRMKTHQCCPGCGHFCTQGKFLQCQREGGASIHHFHRQCQVFKSGKNFCPHCGQESAHVEASLFLSSSETSSGFGTTTEKLVSKLSAKIKFHANTYRKFSPELSEETETVSCNISKTGKTLTSAGLAFGPERYSLEKVLHCLNTEERPKKYRSLPKCVYIPAAEGDLDKLAYMLIDDHDPNMKWDEVDNQVALHAAAAAGYLAMVHLLVQCGSFVHAADLHLKTPLMCAAEGNHVPVMQYLIRAGANVHGKMDDGMTSLHLAAREGHMEAVKCLMANRLSDPNSTDDGGWTPIIWATENRYLEIVKFLLFCGSDPNIKDNEENTALHWAAFSGSADIAELFFRYGCDIESVNEHGDRPLHIAARQGHYECVVLLLARGADVEATNHVSFTPVGCCLDQSSPVSLALKVNRQLKGLAAKRLRRPKKLLIRDISKGKETSAIPCVNDADDDDYPQDYFYVMENVETSPLNINHVITSLQWCQCKDNCGSSQCACSRNSVKCWFDKEGRLLSEVNLLDPPLVFECNRACNCWTTCNNRVVQNGITVRMELFKTTDRGWGVKTLLDIPVGTFVCEYIGELISDSEADRREDDSYLFDLDNRDGETYCIDARKYGNVARFINHLCEPNLIPVKVFVEHQDLRFPKICLFASRDIMANEELGFDYGEKFWVIKWKQFTCTCGLEKCKYSVDTIHKTLEDYRRRHEDDEEIASRADTNNKSTSKSDNKTASKAENNKPASKAENNKSVSKTDNNKSAVKADNNKSPPK